MKKNADRIHVRPAVEKDVKKVAALSRLWAKEGAIRGLIPDTPRMLRSYVGGLFLIAESQAGDIVGYACASKRVSDRNCLAVFDLGTPYVEVENIHVVPGLRGRGTGSRLLRELLKLAKKDGVERAIAFSSSVDWERVVAFYARHGFKMWFFQMFK